MIVSIAWAKRPLAARLPLLLLTLLASATTSFADPQARAEQARQAFDHGAFAAAAAGWENTLAELRGDPRPDPTVRAAISLAAAYQALGQPRRALDLLEATLPRATECTDASLGLLLKARLGGALVLGGNLERADRLLGETLAAAQAENHDSLVADVLNDRGNLHLLRQEFADALVAYERGADVAARAGDRPARARALVNGAATALRSGDRAKATTLQSAALEAVRALEATHARAFLLLTAALTDRDLGSPSAPDGRPFFLRAHQSFAAALELAETLDDTPILTYALGHLGHLYELDGQTEAALGLTRRAVFAAQQANLPEALFRWEWQAGRLHRARQEIEAALAAYRRAVQTLQPIRHDLTLGFGNAATHLPFRESEGPIYFQLADLLLREAHQATDPDQAQPLLREARDTVEQLKAVELEDYFRDECVNLQRRKTRALDAIDPHTAVLYLVPLPDRTELLVGFHDGLKQFRVDLSDQALATEVRELRRRLETRTSYAYLEPARALYDALIRPIRPLLAERTIDTLVFVPDGALRTIPLASLHDGDHFLVEDFAVAVAPGLTLVDPLPIAHDHPKLLLNGLTNSVQGFPPLYFVADELDTVGHYYRGRTLANEGFTLAHLREQMTGDQFSIVHIASHGQFDRDVRKSFVLTYDGKLTMDDLESLVRPSQYRGRPVDLLVLSACQTAAGDDRAALGLAGVAVKAGARSALATLWFVNDQSTSVLVAELYAQLRQSPSLGKAKALQAAQRTLLGDRQYRHPCYWSPYLVVGNWR